jgi:hypothetical protein
MQLEATSRLGSALAEDIENAIKRRIEYHVKEAVEQKKKRVCEDLDALIPEIVAGVFMQAMERASMEHLGREVVIRVQMEKRS